MSDDRPDRVGFVKAELAKTSIPEEYQVARVLASHPLSARIVILRWTAEAAAPDKPAISRKRHSGLGQSRNAPRQDREAGQRATGLAQRIGGP